MGRILGIDYGAKRVGLALGDPSGTFARPLEVVERSPRLWERLRGLVAAERVERIVVGLPRNMDGSLGPKAREVLEFNERLKLECGVPVETWDERLTSVEAQRILRDAGATLRQRQRAVDKVAAQILLQSYLEAQRTFREDAAARSGEAQGEPDEPDGRAGGGDRGEAEMEDQGEAEGESEGEPEDRRDGGEG